MARFAFAILAAALAASACDGPGAASPKRSLPAYQGHAVELFDDAIEPRAVGLELEQSTSPRGDALLRERTQVGDAVMRVRVSTVTAKQEDSGPSYMIAFNVVSRLAGSQPPPDPFTVVVQKNGPAAGILRSFEARLVGRTFIAFVRDFAREGGDAELHFHLAPDTKEVAAAVTEAAALNELK